MFEFSLSELLVICVVALVVLGPKELPVVARTLRDAVRYVRRMSASVQSHINEVLDEDDRKGITNLIKGDDGKFYEAFNLDEIMHDAPAEKQRDHD
jgi:sec-independent protein translocase protein TatB